MPMPNPRGRAKTPSADSRRVRDLRDVRLNDAYRPVQETARDPRDDGPRHVRHEAEDRRTRMTRPSPPNTRQARQP